MLARKIARWENIARLTKKKIFAFGNKERRAKVTAGAPWLIVSVMPFFRYFG
jgi:hypothetical protein